jgi:hypothetical protein
MRVVHFERLGSKPWVEPLCGDWGAMDTDWTDVATGVTCVACESALRGARMPDAELTLHARPPVQ